MESNVLSLPENFEAVGSISGSRRADSAKPARNRLPQWLALYTVLTGQREHAEVRMLCRATELYENWAGASPAELRECEQWSGAFRQRQRDKHVVQKEFYCWVLDRCFVFNAPVRLRRDQFPGKQLQRACRPSQDLYQLLSNRPGRHLMGGDEAAGALLPELRVQKGWLMQVPASLTILSKTEPASVLKLWTPGSLIAGLHIQVTQAPRTTDPDLEECVPDFSDPPVEPQRGMPGAIARWSRDGLDLTPLQEIQMVRLGFAMQNSADMPLVIKCVARFLDPMAGGFSEDTLQKALASVPGKFQVHSHMMRLDWLHMFHRQCLMAEQASCENIAVSRYLSMDASPQGGYEYLAMTEEVIVRALPITPPANPWAGFQHEFRTMPVMTLARGETRTFVKAQRLRSAIILENGEANFQAYRKQVKGWISDQGTERGIPEWPVGEESSMKSLAASLREGVSGDALAAGTGEAFLFNSCKHPGVLHVLFNSLEECCKACPRWDVVEKQVSAVSKLLTNRSYREIVVSVMMKHATAQQKRTVQGYHGELLSWRWESLHVTLQHYLEVRPVLLQYWDRELLSSEAALCDTVDAALQDPFHLAYVHWAYMFACFIQEWAHWFEGCFCHEAELKASRARAKIKCPWKGKRSCVLCAGFKDEIARSVFRLASASFTEVVLQLPTEVAAAMALMDQQAREKWAAIIKEKLAYLGHVPHLLAGAFAHHAMPDQFSLQRSKDIVRECFTQYEQVKAQGRTTALLELLFHRKADAGLAEQLWAFCESPEDKVLEDFPLAWTEIQDRAFCPLVERSTERQHVLIKIACQRTLRHAGPAMTCVRARRSQLQAMIDDPQKCSFLVSRWRMRHLDSHLLSHVMPRAEIVTKTRSYRVSRIYGYSEEDHFMDEFVEEETAAQALKDATQLALRDGCGKDAERTKDLDRKQWMIVDYLKGQLSTGILFSMPESLFQALLGDSPCEELAEEVVLDLESFAQGLLPTDIPVIPAQQLIYGYILDSRPERRTQNTALGEGNRKGHVHVLRFTNVDLQDPGMPGVLYSSSTQHTLNFANLATPSCLKLLSSQVTIWTPKATSVQVHILPGQQEAGSLALANASRPTSLRLPAFVTDEDMLQDLVEGPDSELGSRALCVPPAATQSQPVVQAGLLTNAEQGLLQTLLECRAMGDNFVDILQLPYFNNEACQGLRDRALIQAREDEFGALTLALSDATRVSSRLVLQQPTLLCHEEVAMSNVSGRNKLAWLRMLLQDGWHPASGRAGAAGDWHKQGAAKKLPSGLLDRPEMHLKALCLHESIWEKPGGLQQIAHSGSAAYYEMLLKEPDLSGVQAWTLKQCHDFAFEKKRKNNPRAKRAARSEQGPLRLSLELPTIPSVACRVPGMEDFQVHFDNWTHNSGHRRAFIQCRFSAHGNCRRYTFLKNHADQATAVAWLLAWAQDASRHESRQAHVAFDPAAAVVNRMKDRQRLAA